MTSKSARWTLYGALLLLYVLHNDFWLWRDSTVVLGLPVDLLYHVVYCLVVSVLMVLVVRLAWPYSARRDS